MGYRFADENGLILQQEVRNDIIGRVLLHHFTFALTQESTPSDRERIFVKSLYQAIKMSIADFYLQHANQQCKQIVNSDFVDTTDFERLLQSGASTLQGVLIMSRFAQFLLESPYARLLWLIDFLNSEYRNNADNNSGIASFFIDHNNPAIIVGYIKKIFNLIQDKSINGDFYMAANKEIPFIDLNNIFAELLVELDVYMVFLEKV